MAADEHLSRVRSAAGYAGAIATNRRTPPGERKRRSHLAIHARFLRKDSRLLAAARKEMDKIMKRGLEGLER